MLKSVFFFLGVFMLQNAFSQNWFVTGQHAELMVSGKDFNHTGGYFNHPNGLATDGTHFLLCDRFNNRVLVWNSLPATWDAAPDLVLGQPDFSSNNPGSEKHQLNWAGNVSAANGKVAVADTENDRLLLWLDFPSQNGQPADVSVFLPALSDPGTSLFYGWPWGVWTDGTRLAAVATTGAALLFWDNFPTSDNTPPDYVIQLADFGTPRNISTDGSSYFFVGDHNAKVNNGPGTFFWNSYPVASNQPYDFYRDEWIKGEKLQDGKLIAGGIRSIYVWHEMPLAADQNPDLSLPLPFYKNGDGVDLTFADGRLYVNNYNGNNVLVFNGIPDNLNDLPEFALGSPGYEAQTLDSIYYVQNPVPLTDGTRLIASSDFDRAVYMWDQFPVYSGQPYDHKIQMPSNVHLWAAALHQNTFVAGARNSLSVWEDATQIGPVPDRILVNQIGSALLDNIRGVALDDTFFYLATQSGKLHVWPGVPTDGSQNPVLTLSSSSGPFGFLYSDGEYLCAARPEPPSGVDIYRVEDLVAGIVTPFKVINSGFLRINQASQAVTFNGALAIASRGDHRVLLWQSPAHWGNPDAAVVLGQPGLQSFDAAIGVNRLFMPAALLPREQELWVGEFKFSSRIVKYGFATTSAAESSGLKIAAQLFPNPALAHCSVEFMVTQTGVCQLDLLDGQGRFLQALFSGKLNAGETFRHTFSTETLSKGLYFVRIRTENGRTVLKMVR
ncbi:MAG: T9SS type A sorting domain-containing protein [Saprospiraceae bacterium]|nr:T9SS type A sorting domain-containing protein [Saprospiraceae bacterium]